MILFHNEEDLSMRFYNRIPAVIIKRMIFPPQALRVYQKKLDKGYA
jgi:hypothetical protein